MKLIKSTLLCIGIATTLPLFAANVQITNGEFDNNVLADNTSGSYIEGWNKEGGLIGLFNPNHSIFLGEQGLGAHRNTLYMIDNARVSQTFNFRTLQNSTYTLSFDVGQRADISMQNYTVKVTAGDETLMEVLNPVRVSEPGTFTTAELSFSNKNVLGEIVQLTIETDGVGHVNFDNFELQYEQTFKAPKASLRPVAYGLEMERFSGSKRCFNTTSLEANDQSFTQYLPFGFIPNACYCYKSKLVVLDEETNLPQGHYERRIMCVLSSEE